MDLVKEQATNVHNFISMLDNFFNELHYCPMVIPMRAPLTETKIFSRCDFEFGMEPRTTWGQQISAAISSVLKRGGFEILPINSSAALYKKEEFVVVINVTATTYSKPKTGITFIKSHES